MKTYRRSTFSWLLVGAPLVLASTNAHADSNATFDARADVEALGRVARVPTFDLCDHASGHVHCMAKVVTTDTGEALRVPLANGATPKGFGPTDLLSAYSLPSTGGKGKTVAVVDAFDAPNAESDLAVYRTQFNLPACTTANGCFKKVSQRGDTTYPPTDGKGPDGWEGEIMLDIEMISAVCSQCNILLVETDDDQSNANFEAALATAAKLGASAISNSYGGGEDKTILDEETSYHQPGILVTASAGDSGFGASYPATSSGVLAVGGTTLAKSASSRGWGETAWAFAHGGGTGSGCSKFIAKPAYQKDTACSMRMESDVSAVADPATGVATYDAGTWEIVGGTSASSPIVASAFVLLGLEKAGLDFAYQNPTAFFDILSGSNDPKGGSACGNNYECVAMAGYDGPTGWGTPNGTVLSKLGSTTVDAGVDSGSSGSTPTSGDGGTTRDAGPGGVTQDDAGTPTLTGGTGSGGDMDAGGSTGNGATGNPVSSAPGSPSAGLGGSSGCAVGSTGSSAPTGTFATLTILGAIAVLARRRRRA